MSIELFGKVLKNLALFSEAQKVGFDYILNPDTGELHKTDSPFSGPHNLAIADLEEFIGLTNVGMIPPEYWPDGVSIPVYDLSTGELLGHYSLNKCEHCFD